MFDMVPVTFSDYLLEAMPLSYVGEWRMIFEYTHNVEGGQKLECYKFLGDIFDDSDNSKAPAIPGSKVPSLV